MEYGKFNGSVFLLFHRLLLTTLQPGDALRYNCLALPLTDGRYRNQGRDATINFTFVFSTPAHDFQAAKSVCNNGDGTAHRGNHFRVGAHVFEITCTAPMTDTVVRLFLWTSHGRRGHHSFTNVNNSLDATSNQTYLSCSCNGSQSPSKRCGILLKINTYDQAYDYFIVTENENTVLEYTTLFAHILPLRLNCLTSNNGFESEGSLNEELLGLSKGTLFLNTIIFNLKVQVFPWRQSPNNFANDHTILNGIAKKKRQKRTLACQLEKFGPHCEYSCHCALSKPCHTITGACLNNKCALGWAGPSCSDRACVSTEYLNLEDQRCLPCPCNNSDCDILTGRCHASCGLETSCMQQLCNRHFFSPPNCKRMCSCWADSACHPVTGMCSSETCISDLYEPPTCSEPHPRVSLFHIMNAMMILTVLTLTKLLVFLVIAKSNRERLNADLIYLQNKAKEKAKYMLSVEEGTVRSQEKVGERDTGLYGLEEAGSGREEDISNEAHD